MEIYLEYALFENFLVDGTLLFLSLTASRRKIFWRRLLLSAFCGAVFAVLFPLLPLPNTVLFAIKFLLPVLLCVLAVKKQNGRGRYALTILLFYAFSFLFAGLLFGAFGAFDIEYFTVSHGGIVTQVPVGGMFAALTVFSALSVYGVKLLYAKKKAQENIYSCTLLQGDKKIVAFGFLDTGNTAQYKGLPVCFVTPDILYDLFSEENAAERTVIRTLAGEKSVPVFKISRVVVRIGKTETGIEGVYLSPSAGLIGRDYKILLPAIKFEERERRE